MTQVGNNSGISGVQYNKENNTLTLGDQFDWSDTNSDSVSEIMRNLVEQEKITQEDAAKMMESGTVVLDDDDGGTSHFTVDGGKTLILDNDGGDDLLAAVDVTLDGSIDFVKDTMDSGLAGMTQNVDIKGDDVDYSRNQTHDISNKNNEDVNVNVERNIKGDFTYSENNTNIVGEINFTENDAQGDAVRKAAYNLKDNDEGGAGKANLNFDIKQNYTASATTDKAEGIEIANYLDINVDGKEGRYTVTGDIDMDMKGDVGESTNRVELSKAQLIEDLLNTFKSTDYAGYIFEDQFYIFTDDEKEGLKGGNPSDEILNRLLQNTDQTDATGLQKVQLVRKHPGHPVLAVNENANWSGTSSRIIAWHHPGRDQETISRWIEDSMASIDITELSAEMTTYANGDYFIESTTENETDEVQIKKKAQRRTVRRIGGDPRNQLNININKGKEDTSNLNINQNADVEFGTTLGGKWVAGNIVTGNIKTDNVNQTANTVIDGDGINQMEVDTSNVSLLDGKVNSNITHTEEGWTNVKEEIANFSDASQEFRDYFKPVFNSSSLQNWTEITEFFMENKEYLEGAFEQEYVETVVEEAPAAKKEESNMGSVAKLTSADRLAKEAAQDTQANIDALYGIQVIIESLDDEFMSTLTGNITPQVDDIGDAAKIVVNLRKSGYEDYKMSDIILGLDILKDASIKYSDGLDEAEKSLINKSLTDMTNDGKINEAISKKIQELGDFVSQQMARG